MALAKSKRRIVQVIAPAPFGGAETVVSQLLIELAAKAVPTTAVVLGVADPHAHPWVCSLKDAQVEVIALPPSRLHEYRGLRSILRQPLVSAVHSHGYRADFACWMAREPSVRWVSTAHGYTGDSMRVRVYESLDRRLLGKADAVIAVSSKLRTTLTYGHCDPDRVALVRNVPGRTDPLSREQAREELGLPFGELVVGWVGRFSLEKGADRLPKIFGAADTACTVALLGDGVLRESVCMGLSQLSQVQARWIGVRRDAARLLAAFDVLILPSRTEGMPMVVLEAMASGVPVVAFDVGDVSYAVDETTGWLVAPDDLTAFSLALRTALTDTTGRTGRGRNAISHLNERFSRESWIDQHLAVYGLLE